jgi:hypothetical protein
MNGSSKKFPISTSRPFIYTHKMEPLEVNILVEWGKVNLQITSPELIEAYERNPGKFESDLRIYLYEAGLDLICDGEASQGIYKINKEACLKKRNLMKKLQTAATN